VCVCVSVFVCVRACVRACMCVCVSARAHVHVFARAHAVNATNAARRQTSTQKIHADTVSDTRICNCAYPTTRQFLEETRE